VTLGSPLALEVVNKDAKLERLEDVDRPRPGHADLPGAIKHLGGVRAVLERASARETAARVAAGALARQLLSAFGIEVAILEPSAYHTDLGGPAVKAVGDAERLPHYEAQLVAFAEKLRLSDPAAAAAADPEEVARAVADAISADTLPLRTPVGASAEALVRLRSESTTGEFRAVILDKTGLGEFVKAPHR
jgi:chorismate synthase